MVHSVQNPWSWLAGRIFGFLISVTEFLFLNFVFDREAATALQRGWVWGLFVFYPTSSEKFFENTYTWFRLFP